MHQLIADQSIGLKPGDENHLGRAMASSAASASPSACVSASWGASARVSASTSASNQTRTKAASSFVKLPEIPSASEVVVGNQQCCSPDVFEAHVLVAALFLPTLLLFSGVALLCPLLHTPVFHCECPGVGKLEGGWGPAP